jgi:hypothetical protein
MTKKSLIIQEKKAKSISKRTAVYLFSKHHAFFYFLYSPIDINVKYVTEVFNGKVASANTWMFIITNNLSAAFVDTPLLERVI